MSLSSGEFVVRALPALTVLPVLTVLSAPGALSAVRTMSAAGALYAVWGSVCCQTEVNAFRLPKARSSKYGCIGYVNLLSPNTEEPYENVVKLLAFYSVQNIPVPFIREENGITVLSYISKTYSHQEDCPL